LMRGEVLTRAVTADEPIMIDVIDTPYASVPSLRATIYNRGVKTSNAASKA